MGEFRELLNSFDWQPYLGPLQFFTGNLHVIINGTQKREIGLNSLSIKFDPLRKEVQWEGIFRYTLFDDFAFDKNDANKRDLASNILRPSYYLQGFGIAKPYGIRMEIEEWISGKQRF